MLLVIIKLVEVLARAGFTVGITFALPLAAAGQFGLAATLIGLFAFAFGWERHIDVQRRLVGADAARFDRAVLAMTRLWLVNYLWMLPLFGAAAFFWLGLSWYQTGLVLVIAVCEQVSNSAYNLSVVEPRYRRLVIVVAIKNLILLVAALAMIFVAPARLSFGVAIEIWAILSVAATVIVGLIWLMLRVHVTNDDASDAPLQTGLFVQHRASLTHFLTGLLAVLVIQFDRLTVGGLVSLDQAGVYFRHVMLVAFAYQFFNVASYNRRLPQIFSLTRDVGVHAAQRLIRFELAMVGGLVIAGFAGAIMLDRLSGADLMGRFHIIALLLAVLLAAALVRTAADFEALILNARMRERRVLRNQIIGFVTGATMLIGMTVQFGIFGTAAASLASAMLYLALNLAAVRVAQHDNIGDQG